MTSAFNRNIICWLSSWRVSSFSRSKDSSLEHQDFGEWFDDVFGVGKVQLNLVCLLVPAEFIISEFDISLVQGKIARVFTENKQDFERNVLHVNQQKVCL